MNEDYGILELFLPDVGRAVDRWTSYSFNSHFLTPADGFSLTVENPRLDPIMEDGLVPGAKVQLRVAGCTQATGYLDSVERTATRSGGIVWTLEGRDALGQAVDSGIDPREQFKETETLQDLLVRVFEPFGWGASQIQVDEGADQQIKTGRKLRQPRKPTKHPRASKLPQLRPNNGEGAYEFAARVAKRFGMQIWPSADGLTLYVGKPDFEQEATFTLIRKRGGARNNILDGSAKFDMTEQPSFIVADGFSGGGAFGKSKLRIIALNPAMAITEAQATAVGSKFKTAKVVNFLDPKGRVLQFAPYPYPNAKPLYLHDENSKTEEQLEAFARREMMARVRKSLTYHVTVSGHGQASGGGPLVPWTVGAVVDVQDEVTGVIEPMWVLSRTFEKNRDAGTRTRLELIRLYSLDL